MASPFSRLHLASLASLFGLALCSTLAAPSARAGSCEFLSPVGGDGVSPIVTKTISMGNTLCLPNWNTDIYVTKPYTSYKLFFTADSSVNATYPVQAYMKFTDGSNLQVFNADLAPQPGTGGGKVVPAVPGKQVSQVNIKVGSSANMAATGFTYRVSVQGCR